MKRSHSSFGKRFACTLIIAIFINWFITHMADAQLPCRYDYAFWPNADCGFGPFPGDPVALNVHGDLVGRWVSCGEPVAHTFIWTGGPSITILPIPPGYRAMDPEDMNDLGEIVGTLQLPTGPFRPFLRKQDGQVVDLGLPTGATVGHALGINNKSEVVGYSSGPNGSRAFLWKDGLFTELNLPTGPHGRAHAINNNSQITGWMGNYPLNSSGFIWQDGSVIEIPPLAGTTSVYPTAISQSGRVVGPSRIWPGGDSHGFLFENGSLTDLGVLPKFDDTWPSDCNETVVIGTCSREGDADGFVWSEGVIAQSSDLLPIPTIQAIVNGAVTEDGRIASRVKINDEWFGLILTPVGPFTGDVNNDCVVNVPDLLNVIDNWGSCVPKSPCPADLNNDAIVDVWDIVLVVQNWGSH